MSDEYTKNVESAVEAGRQDAGRWHSAEEAAIEPANLTFDQAQNLVEEFGVKAEYLHYCTTARVDPTGATIDSAMVSTIARWMAPFLAAGALTRPKLKKAIKSVRTEIKKATEKSRYSQVTVLPRSLKS